VNGFYILLHCRGQDHQSTFVIIYVLICMYYIIYIYYIYYIHTLYTRSYTFIIITVSQQETVPSSFVHRDHHYEYIHSAVHVYCIIILNIYSDCGAEVYSGGPSGNARGIYLYSLKRIFENNIRAPFWPPLNIAVPSRTREYHYYRDSVV
jgi:hypothetical protein